MASQSAGQASHVTGHASEIRVPVNVASQASPYVLIIVAIGVPLLILVGYLHYKRTLAYRSETDVTIESNPYQARNVVNNTINVELSLKMFDMLLKLSKDQKLTENEIEELDKAHKKFVDFNTSRSFMNRMDIDFVKKNVSKTQ